MIIIRHLLLLLIIAVNFISCSSARILLDVPEHIVSKQTEKINVKGVKGKGLPGSKRPIKFEHKYSGIFKDGWVVSSATYDKTPRGIFSAEASKRSLLLNLGLNINDVISKTSDRFQFTLSDSINTMIVFCNQQQFGQSINYKFKDKGEFSLPKTHSSSFGAVLLPGANSVKAEWRLVLKYNLETYGGTIAAILSEGTAVENGFLTDKTDTIFIKPLLIKKYSGNMVNKIGGASFKIVGGYEFRMGDNTIGIVDLINPSFTFFTETNTIYKLVIAAASTALLLRNR